MRMSGVGAKHPAYVWDMVVTSYQVKLGKLVVESTAGEELGQREDSNPGFNLSSASSCLGGLE